MRSEVLPRFDDGSGKIVYQAALYLGLHLLPHTYHGCTYWDHTYWGGT